VPTPPLPLARAVLSNPNVSCLVVSFSKPQHFDEYIWASGGRLTNQGAAILSRYDAQVAGTYCHPHCGACLPACPERLAVTDGLRYRMYFEDYGREREGMCLYAALERDARRCETWPAPCAAACPVDVPIRQRMLGADALLRLPA